MDETGQEVRPSSGDSESGSEGFVQVTQEDAKLASQGTEEHQLEQGAVRIPAVDDDADLYGAPEDGEGEGEEEEEGGPVYEEEEKEEEAEPDVYTSPMKEPLLVLETDMSPQPPLVDLETEMSPHEPLLDLQTDIPPQGPLLEPEPSAPSQGPLLDLGPFEALPPEPQPVETAPHFTGEITTEPQDVTPPEHEEMMSFESQETTPLVEPTAPPPVVSSEPEETTPPEIQKPSKPGVEEVPRTTAIPERPAKPPKAGLPKPAGYLGFLNMLHPVVLYIIYWCDVKLSAVVLGVCLVVLLTLTLNTVLHTVVLLLLSFMVVSLTYIVIKVVIDSFYNKKVHNPFNGYLSSKVALPEKEILEWTQYAIEKLNVELDILVRLLLFDNIKYSLMFGCFLWLASFVTNCCSFLSLLFLLVCVSFTVPVLYAHFQSPIDGFLDKAVAKIGALLKKVIQYIPLGKKVKAE